MSLKSLLGVSSGNVFIILYIVVSEIRLLTLDYYVSQVRIFQLKSVYESVDLII